MSRLREREGEALQGVPRLTTETADMDPLTKEYTAMYTATTVRSLTSVAPCPLEVLACEYCSETGTTIDGALWRTTLDTPYALFYLHSACLAPYKAAHSLRSVEGRLPLTHARTRVRSHSARRSAPGAWTVNRSAAL